MPDLTGVKVGDELLLISGIRHVEPRTVHVEKIGRKLLHIAYERGGYTQQFRIENGRLNNTQYSGSSYVITHEAWTESQLRGDLFRMLRVKYGATFQNQSEITTAKAEQILSVLEADCLFHDRPYPEHDFTYGSQCRRCGTESE